MDILDSQVHLGPGGAAEMVAAMDALGVRSVLLDEWWMGSPGHPAYRVGDGGFRTASPTAELASWTYPGRFSYLIRLDRRDPDVRSVVRLARDAAYVRALRISPGMTRAELADFAAGAFDALFAAAADYGFPIFVYLAGHAPLLTRYLQKFPDLKVIICHCGMPPAGSMLAAVAAAEALPDSADYWTKLSRRPLAETFGSVLRLADFANVALKWAHAPLMFDAAGYPNAATPPSCARPWTPSGLSGSCGPATSPPTRPARPGRSCCSRSGPILTCPSLS